MKGTETGWGRQAGGDWVGDRLFGFGELVLRARAGRVAYFDLDAKCLPPPANAEGT